MEERSDGVMFRGMFHEQAKGGHSFHIPQKAGGYLLGEEISDILIPSPLFLPLLGLFGIMMISTAARIESETPSIPGAH
jgi:hypothetical protein